MRSDITRRTVRTEEDHKVNQDKTEDNFYETMPLATPLAGIQSSTVTETETVTNERSGSGLLLLEQIFAYATGVVEVLLGLRLILAVFNFYGAITTTSGIARLIYNLTRPLVAPFTGLFNTTSIDPGAWTIAFAMLVYAIIGYAIVKLIQLFGESRA